MGPRQSAHDLIGDAHGAVVAVLGVGLHGLVGAHPDGVDVDAGPDHIHGIADPDPKWDPGQDGWYNAPPPSGVGDARWTANSLPDPATFPNGWYWLGEPSAADYTIGITPAAQRWAPDASTPSAPAWRSIFPYKPSVWPHVHYGPGGQVLTISRGVRFNLQFVEHMWMDWGKAMPQPFTWVFVAVVMDFPTPTYAHTLLDMGRDPREVGFPALTDTQAMTGDYAINDGEGYRNELLISRDHMSMTSEDAPPAGRILHAGFAAITRPRMFFGVFDSNTSLVGNYSRDGKWATRGAIGNTPGYQHRFNVMGRRKDHISSAYASHLVVFEARYWASALSVDQLNEQYDQLSSTWKFGEYA